MRSNSILLLIGALNGALGVVLGAFGAHGLADLLERTGRADTWETATLYQLAHAPVIIVITLSLPYLIRPHFGRLASICWLVGVLIFSGSLYLLSAGGPNWLGAITPIGGLLLILGWLFLAGAGGIHSFNHKSQ